MWFSRILLACALLSSSTVWADTFKLVTFEYPPYEYTENGETKGMAVEIVRQTRAAVGPDFLIVFRLSMADLVEEGQSWNDIVAGSLQPEARLRLR